MEDGQLIIAVSREFGSAGHVIAEHLAKHYNLPLYDDNFLKEVLSDKGVENSEIHKYDEKHKRFGVYRAVRGMDSSPEAIIAKMQFEFLKKKASAGESYVIVGRCAETVLKEYPALVSIFVMGDKKEKIERISEIYNLPPDKAERLRIEKDYKRRKYHNNYCDMKWGDSRNYQICINSSKIGIDGTLAVLICYIDEKRKHKH